MVEQPGLLPAQCVTRSFLLSSLCSAAMTDQALALPLSLCRDKRALSAYVTLVYKDVNHILFLKLPFLFNAPHHHQYAINKEKP